MACRERAACVSADKRPREGRSPLLGVSLKGKEECHARDECAHAKEYFAKGGLS